MLAPVALLEPLRIANQYGLFAVMTRGRYEIEFQGSNDGIRLDRLSLPQQTAGAQRSARASTPPISRASTGTSGSHRSATGIRTRSSRSPKSACSSNDANVLALFRANPFPHVAPALRPRRALAILVHFHGRKTPHRQLVASSVPRHLRPRPHHHPKRHLRRSPTTRPTTGARLKTKFTDQSAD